MAPAIKPRPPEDSFVKKETVEIGAVKRPPCSDRRARPLPGLSLEDGGTSPRLLLVPMAQLPTQMWAYAFLAINNATPPCRHRLVENGFHIRLSRPVQTIRNRIVPATVEPQNPPRASSDALLIGSANALVRPGRAVLRVTAHHLAAPGTRFTGGTRLGCASAVGPPLVTLQILRDVGCIFGKISWRIPVNFAQTIVAAILHYRKAISAGRMASS